MRSVALLLLVVAGLLTAACGSDTSTTDGGPTGTSSPPTTSTTDPGTPSPTAEPSTLDGVTLTVSGEVGVEPAMGSGDPAVTKVTGAAKGLLIRYTVSNTLGAPVLAVDRLPNGTGTMSITDAPDPLRTVVRPADGATVEFVKYVDPSGSQGLDYTAQVQASVVAAGAEHTGRAFVPFPAEEYAGISPFPSDATSWRFCVGVIADPSGFPTSADGSVALVPATALDAAHQQAVLCSDPQPLPAGWNG